MEANLFSNTRIEAYVRVSFCGSQAITSVVCVRGRARLAPEFNEELWLPVTEPTETRRISVGLWNYSSHTRDRPIAHLYFDLDDIERSSKYISGSFLGGGLLEQNNYMGPRPQEPYVRIDVPAPNDRGNCFRTQPSSVPSGRNANFLERKVMAIDMPENPLYAPNLDLRVYDARVGISAGLHKRLLGASSIDLSSKLPWNSEAFVAPQTELFSGSDVWQQEKERNEESHLRTQSELLGSGLSQWTCLLYTSDAADE